MIKKPSSVEECIYYTNRLIDKGEIIAWVFKEQCPKCKKALMGKPKDPKTGRPKTRANIYVCPACNYTIPKEEYEQQLTINIEYTCPYCNNKADTTAPFKWEKTKIEDPETGKKKSVDVIKFSCSKCKKELHISRKMKA